LLTDIGGGSTEFLVGEGAEMVAARSVKLGAIRLTDRFFAREPLVASQVRECRRYVRAFLAPVVREVAQHGFDLAVGSSGTILSVAEMVAARRGETARSLRNATITRKELAKVVAALVDAPTARQRSKVPGLDAGRADIIVAGSLLLDQAMAAFEIETLTVSDYALREGLLLDTLERRVESLHGHLSDIRSRSVRHLSELAPTEQAHAEQARGLALALFDQTAERHGLGREWRELLEAAALLANVGLAISHDGHHLHSYYVIRNAERLRGFTEGEVEIIAQVARYHRKSAPKAKHLAFAALTAPHQRVVRILAGILRVAIALDRTHSKAVTHLTCTLDGSALTITVEAGSDPSLELYTAEERRGLLEAALGVRAVFAVAGVAGRGAGSLGLATPGRWALRPLGCDGDENGRR
ncbi:MAG: Ppx/GppA phosphatase family protein, partial [Acidimicrobiales bacterium]